MFTVSMTFRYVRPDGTTDSVTVERNLNDQPGDVPGVVYPDRIEPGIQVLATRLADDAQRLYGLREAR